MKKKAAFLFFILLILTFCCCEQSPSEQFKQGFQALSENPIHATSLLTSGDNKYSTEILYVNGEDYLHITNGPEGLWQSIDLYVRKDYYSGFTHIDDRTNSYDLTYQTTTSLPVMPVTWMEQRWEDVKDTVVSTIETDGILSITCEDSDLTTVFELKDGRILSIAYTALEKLQDLDGNPVYREFTNTYTFHPISSEEITEIFEEYLAKAEKK